MKPVCVGCQRFFKPKKTGTYFIEAMPIGDNAPAGVEHPELWTPYKLWAGDLYECEGCGAQTIVGVGRKPIAEHYQPGFKDAVQSYRARIQVNDC